MTDKKHLLRTLGLAAAVFAAVCAVFRPQLLSLLWESVCDVATPLVCGGLFAFLLFPLFRLLSRLTGFLPGKAGDTTALILTYLLFGAAVAGFFVFLVPQLTDSLGTLYSHSQQYADNLGGLFMLISERFPFLKAENFAHSDLPAKLYDSLGVLAKKLVPHLLSATVGLAELIFQASLGFFFSVYLLSGRRRLLAQFETAVNAWLPPKAAKGLFDFLALCRRIFYGYMTGLLLDCMILSVACGIGMQLLGFAYPALISLLVGICNLVPVIGGTVGCLLSFLLLVSVNPLQAVWFVVYLTILQQLEGRFLYPRIVGERLGLPAFWVLLSVLLGGEIGGLGGIVFSIPLCAVAYHLLRRKTACRLKEKAPPKLSDKNKTKQE